MPSVLWMCIDGEGDFTPLWVFEHLRDLGYVPTTFGFWWLEDLPLRGAERFAAFLETLDEAYPETDCQ